MFFYLYLETTGWIFDISLLCENSINQIVIFPGWNVFVRFVDENAGRG